MTDRPRRLAQSGGAQPRGIDGWYESEEVTRLGMVSELQRIRRRFVVRPLPALVLAALITTAVAYKVATSKKLYTADVVLALSEGSLSSSRDRSIPFQQLKEYVSTVLLPDGELKKLIERRKPGRIEKFGAQFVLEGFRDSFTVQIWKNSFVYYASEDETAQKSARIGIEVTDADPDAAQEVARELAEIAIRTHDEQRRKLTQSLAGEIAKMRESMRDKLDASSTTISAKQRQLAAARASGNNALAAMLIVELTTLAADRDHDREQLNAVAGSQELLADRAAAAEFGTTITVVDDVPPERHEQSGMVLAMVIAVVGVGSLLGSALVLGAFDSRVHDAEDVARLDLPVLGHLPGFPGDHVGSLEARGAARARVPSFLRWLSQQ